MSAAGEIPLPLELDRVAGILVGGACGDALGAGYEMYLREIPAERSQIAMIGGGLGNFAVGEWTDDTSMAWSVALAAGAGADLRTPAGLDAIAEGFVLWAAGNPPDIGNQTSRVLKPVIVELRAEGVLTSEGGVLRVLSNAGLGARLSTASAADLAAGNQGAGNGSLMRTGAVVAAHLGDDAALAEAAAAVSALTHADLLAQEACVLWCIAIDRAVREGRLDGIWDGLALLEPARSQLWRGYLEAAAREEPESFTGNGFVVRALQAALSAIWHTPELPLEANRGVFPCQQLQEGLRRAVSIGDDTDTVAAICGSLLGARWGVSAVPFEWRRLLHGWPQQAGQPRRARDLVALALAARVAGDESTWPRAARLAERDAHTWAARPETVSHPDEAAILLGTTASLVAHECSETPSKITAVVSASRLGLDEVPARGVRPENHHEVWLLDAEGPGINPNLEFVLEDAANAARVLAAEGHTVLVHCIRAEHRTPAIGATISILRGARAAEARAQLGAALPHSAWRPSFAAALEALERPE